MGFTTSPRLKRSLLVIGALLLLLAGIGFQSLGFRSETPPVIVMSRPDEKATRSPRVMEPLELSREIAQPPPADTGLAAENPHNAAPEDNPVTQIRPSGSGATSGQLPSLIYLVRIQSLLQRQGSRESIASDMEMVRRAVAQVSSTLPPGAVVLDAEGLSTSQIPVVTYAKPRYDLTKDVAAVFEELNKQQQKLAEGG